MEITQEILLGVDYGSHHVGFAIKSEGTTSAMPLSIFERNGGSDEQLIEHIKDLVAEHKITAVIIGMPLTMEGKPGPQAERVALFIHLFHRGSETPMYDSDERLTSAAVDHGAHDKAAALILQGYIDREMNGNNV